VSGSSIRLALACAVARITCAALRSAARPPLRLVSYFTDSSLPSRLSRPVRLNSTLSVIDLNPHAGRPARIGDEPDNHGGRLAGLLHYLQGRLRCNNLPGQSVMQAQLPGFSAADYKLSSLHHSLPR